MMLVIAAAASFALGLYVVLTRRDLIAILIGAEVMLGAANVELLTLALSNGADPAAASAFSLLVLVVTAAEAAVGLALVVTAFKRTRRARIDEFEEVRG